MSNLFSKVLLVVGVWMMALEIGQSQNRYLVYFKDKAGTSYSTANPQHYLSARAIARRQRQHIAVSERDFPPNASYIQSIKNLGATVLYKTRWLNGVLVETNSATLSQILALPFVKGIEGNGDIRNARVSA